MIDLGYGGFFGFRLFLDKFLGFEVIVVIVLGCFRFMGKLVRLEGR